MTKGALLVTYEGNDSVSAKSLRSLIAMYLPYQESLGEIPVPMVVIWLIMLRIIAGQDEDERGEE